MSRSEVLVLSCKVLTDEVVADSLGLDAPKLEQPPSRPLSCVSRRVVGFNSSTIPQNVVNALHIEAHLADAPALSCLKIRGGGRVPAGIRILAVDNNLILLASTLPTFPRTRIYIIYDAFARSISMIPSHPWSQPCKPLSKDWEQRATALVSRILVARPSGDDRSYALVAIAEMAKYSKRWKDIKSQDALYLWRSSSPQWDLIKARFPAKFKGHNVSHSYEAVLAFSFGGRAFWANLVHGIMYCRCDALLTAPSSGDSKLKFGFIELPDELRHPPQVLPLPHVLCSMELRSNMYRTMGRAGETIKFVTIDGFMELNDFVHCTLRVWSLSQDMTSWTKSSSLCLGSLAKQDKFKNGGLSTDMVPMYPSLSMVEDGIIYFMLGNYASCCLNHEGSKEKCKEYVPIAGKPLHLLRVDMFSGVLLDSVSIPHQLGAGLTFCDLGRYLGGATSHDP
jgi:hypothetical protein